MATATATTPPGTFLPSATPTGLILPYYDYGLSQAGASTANPFTAAAAAAVGGYSDAAILTPFLAPTFAPSPIVSNSTPGHHHQHYTNGTSGHHSSQQAMAAALGITQTGTGATSSVSATNPSAASAAATAAAAAFYLNGSTTNGFLTGLITPSSTGAYLTDTRI